MSGALTPAEDRGGVAAPRPGTMEFGARRVSGMNGHVLGSEGLIARAMPGYEHRAPQVAMAEAVTEAFEVPHHLMVEAGTGVGKSFAYLLPAIARAVHHGQRVVISTHTIALQEQLVHKDIPFLQKVLPEPFLAVLVKGRSNYLGLRRLARASGRQTALFDARGQVAELHRIEDWAYRTQDGSLSDLEEQPLPEVWERVRSESDDCMGRKCPTFGPCFYQRARRRAAEAQLLIVNHALLFSDLALRAEGAAVLPDYELLVLDEAHTVEQVAGDHFGMEVSDTQLRFFLNLLHQPRTGKGLLSRGKSADAVAAVQEARAAGEAYFQTFGEMARDRAEGVARFREPPTVAQGVSPALRELGRRLAGLRADMRDENDRLELEAMEKRCRALTRTVESWHAQALDDAVYWAQAESGGRKRVTLCGRPIDVGALLKEHLFGRLRSVVMTSATLTVAGEDPFGYLRARLGLDDVRCVALGSPFDYREQMKVFVRTGLPDPSSGAAFAARACEAIKEYLTRSGGRAFVLFTSYGMLRECAERIRGWLRAQEMPLLVQGEGLPRGTMLERFRGVPRSVLFGTDTFWAGVDVPGEALSNVIIVKLPFAAPNDPMVEARIEHIRTKGGNPFMDFQVPEAVLKFRQGVGRLIRTRTDRGIVVLLDPRVVSKPYGRRFLEALPDCEVVMEQDGAVRGAADVPGRDEG